MKASGVCQDCHYWRISSDDVEDKGYCHRFPPVMNPQVQMMYPYPRASFPMTAAADFCGEFEANMEDCQHER